MAITREELNYKLVYLNKMIGKFGDKLILSRRYNYYAIDYTSGSTAATGLSAKEANRWLDGFYESLKITGRVGAYLKRGK